MRSDAGGKVWAKSDFFSPSNLSLPTETFLSYNRCQKIASGQRGRSIPKLGRGRLGSPLTKPRATVRGSGHCCSSVPRPLGPAGCPRATCSQSLEKTRSVLVWPLLKALWAFRACWLTRKRDGKATPLTLPKDPSNIKNGTVLRFWNLRRRYCPVHLLGQPGG